MRLFPILAAIVVMVLIYLFVFERDRFGAPDTAAAATPDSNAETGAETDAETGAALPGVIVTRSVARQIDSAVVLRAFLAHVPIGCSANEIDQPCVSSQWPLWRCDWAPVDTSLGMTAYVSAPLEAAYHERVASDGRVFDMEPYLE